MRRTKCLLIATALLTGAFALGREANGTRVGHEGELWLKENAEARNTYAIGYTLGFHQGASEVCEAISSRPQSGVPLDGCLKHDLTISDMTELSKRVTDFYTRYPSDRYLYVTDVMHALGRGMTLEQIHQNATGGGVRMPQ